MKKKYAAMNEKGCKKTEDRKDMEVQLQSKSSGVKKQWFLGSIVHSANKQKAFRTLNMNYNQ